MEALTREYTAATASDHTPERAAGVPYWRGPGRALPGRRQRLEPRFPVHSSAPRRGRILAGVIQEPMRLAVIGRTERRRPRRTEPLSSDPSRSAVSAYQGFRKHETRLLSLPDTDRGAH